jgi:hypothetical protein
MRRRVQVSGYDGAGWQAQPPPVLSRHVELGCGLDAVSAPIAVHRHQILTGFDAHGAAGMNGAPSSVRRECARTELIVSNVSEISTYRCAVRSGRVPWVCSFEQVQPDYNVQVE